MSQLGSNDITTVIFMVLYNITSPPLMTFPKTMLFFTFWGLNMMFMIFSKDFGQIILKIA